MPFFRFPFFRFYAVLQPTFCYTDMHIHHRSKPYYGAVVVLDVLTPLSDCRQESVEKMERRISGVSCMYWMGFYNGILCCGFLCARLISVCLFPATTPRATTPHVSLFSGYHAKGYHAPSIPHGLSRPGRSRLYHHCTAITPVYISRLSRHSLVLFLGLSHPSYHAPPHT